MYYMDKCVCVGWGKEQMDGDIIQLTKAFASRTSKPPGFY